MISRLYGLVRDNDPPCIVLDVQGVGYEISLPLQDCLTLSQKSPTESVMLYTHLVIREDAHQLYGFLRASDRLLFRTLMKVNGVGPKLALAILSGMDPLRFMAHILKNEVQALVGIPGVGRKTAERLVMELRDVFAQWPQETLTKTLESVGGGTQEVLNVAEDQRAIALQALLRLGYKSKEAEQAIAQWGHTAADSATLIRTILQNFGQKQDLCL